MLVRTDTAGQPAPGRTHGGRTRVRLKRVYHVALLVTTLLVAGSTSAVAQAEPSCTTADVPVPGGQFMHGVLCVPTDTVPATVQVLVPGATYNNSYWDFPYDAATYSYRMAMNAAGYATFAVDRLGTGGSSRPLAATLTDDTEAAAVHAVITALRAGRIDGRPFAKVILGGHSLGSIIAVTEAATYHDVDALLLTGFSHQLGVPGSVTFDASLYPAPLDPEFAGTVQDPTYLTTRPGTRQASFYATPTTDPAVVAVDEATKDVVAAGELPQVATTVLLPTESEAVDVPVLIADGSLDVVLCGVGVSACTSAQTLHTAEAPYFGPAACLHTFVLPQAGHDVNLASNTQDYQRAVRDWADTVTGTGPGALPLPPDFC